MHYFHLIAVEAEDEDGAISAAQEALEGYRGEVWDWYEIGGRWDGAIGATGDTEETYVKGVNSLRYTADKPLFNATLDDIESGRQRRAKDLLNELNGRYVRTEDVSRYIYGIEIRDRAEAAERMSRDNRIIGQTFQDILSLETIPNGPLGDEGHFSQANLVLYKLRDLSDLLLGRYTSDSHFYDAVSWTTHTCHLRGRIEEGGTNEWLVVADLHN